ncbi:hypothetical protein MW887_008739 [Aspergillus wentii]|nr:hypothetical protein MW887_008739 [Aspergillus wentii]
MNKDSGYHNGDRAKRVGKNMKEDTMHILIAMRMRMTVSMVMPVMGMVERHDADKVHNKTSRADGQELANTGHLAPGGQPFYRLVDDFDTYDPESC